MKIAVIGYAGAGKSTLARRLGEYYQIPVLHLDRVQFASNWEERDRAEAIALVRAFMAQPQWVIDGNYAKFDQERRLKESDQIIFLNFPRLFCFFRALRRYFSFRGGNRPDMADGCNEKMDLEFIWWLLWEGRTRRRREKFQRMVDTYPQKTVALKRQKELDRFLRELGANK